MSKEKQNKGITGEKGKKGPPGVCPACGIGHTISWDADTGVSTCTCGWSNGESRDKQIEEMANDLAAHCPDLVENCCGASSCVSCLTRFLYTAGYRKQSEKYLVKENGDIEPLNKQSEGIANNATTTGEWINVEDRLPEDDARVLVYLHSNRSYTTIDTDRMLDGKWVRWSADVTHWMPLPEAPKGENNDS